MWMEVLIEVKDNPPVKNTINIDQIVRFGPLDTGAYIKFSSGDTIQVLDPYTEIQHVVLSADAKKDEK